MNLTLGILYAHLLADSEQWKYNKLPFLKIYSISGSHGHRKVLHAFLLQNKLPPPEGAVWKWKTFTKMSSHHQRALFGDSQPSLFELNMQPPRRLQEVLLQTEYFSKDITHHVAITAIIFL